MVLVCMILTIREMSPVVRNMLALRVSCIAQKKPPHSQYSGFTD